VPRELPRGSLQQLGAVVNKIRAKSGTDSTAADGAALIGDVDRVRAVAGCQA
jgi:hypothetical protein